VASCPKCRAPVLNTIQSAEGLHGLTRAPSRCARCKGFWIHLSSVDTLRESGVLETLDEEPELETDTRTGLCPDGHGILARAKASWRRPFYVERCRHCDGIWLDAGEWRRLGGEHLLEHLGELWAPAWRARLEHEQSERALRDLLETRLGASLAERVEAMANELAAHPHGDLALAHLRELFRAKRPRIPTT